MNEVVLIREYLEMVVPNYESLTAAEILSRCEPQFVYIGKDGECHKVASLFNYYYVLNSAVGREAEVADNRHWLVHISNALKKQDYVVFKHSKGEDGGYPLVKDEKLRQKIIATAWPMCAA